MKRGFCLFLVAVLLAGLVPCAFADEAMPTGEVEASEAATEAAEETTAPPETAVPSESTEPPSETTEPPEATETTGSETEVTEPEADPVEDAPEDAVEDDRLAAYASTVTNVLLFDKASPNYTTVLRSQVSVTYNPNGSDAAKTAYIKNLGWHFARYNNVPYEDDPLYCIEPCKNYAASTSGNYMDEDLGVSGSGSTRGSNVWYAMPYSYRQAIALTLLYSRQLWDSNYSVKTTAMANNPNVSTRIATQFLIYEIVTGFYYNHYGMTDGTARYIDGPFDTLEDDAEEVHNYHPQAAQIADSVPDVEEDTFDDVDPQQVREELAKSGIVDGKLVDPEALGNTPFIRQVMADAGAAELPPSSPILPHALQPEVAADDHRNYHISTNDLGAGVPIERFYHNVHAIELLHKLESENRLATPDEQDILSQYVGWGGLPQFFEESNAHYAELKALLTEDEYAAARESTLTAFYTPPVVIRAMYKGLSNLGFHTGNILEPSCGVGNFMGLLPENMENSKMYGVELDSISGRIAQQLYQKNSIAVQGFEKTDLPDSFFDVAIGNVPFGTFKVPDKKYDKYNFLIHDYFFARTLDKVRPGGVVAFITSKGTMDKENPAVRKYIAQRADLLGAIRLPNDTFKAAAGTEVTSDILLLQKRSGMTDLEPDWVHLDTD